MTRNRLPSSYRDVLITNLQQVFVINCSRKFSNILISQHNMYCNVTLGQLKDQKIFNIHFTSIFIAPSGVGFMRAYSASYSSSFWLRTGTCCLLLLSRLKAAMTICGPGGEPELRPRLVRPHHRPPHLAVLRRGQDAAAAAARSARNNEPLSSQCVGPQSNYYIYK